MTHHFRFVRALACFAFTAAASAAHAGTPAMPPDPADADAIVPATLYRPLIAPRRLDADDTTPPQRWKALNEQVGATDSMSLTMDQPSPPAPAAATQEESKHEHGMHAEHPMKENK